jgi:transposase
MKEEITDLGVTSQLCPHCGQPLHKHLVVLRDDQTGNLRQVSRVFDCPACAKRERLRPWRSAFWLLRFVYRLSRFMGL